MLYLSTHIWRFHITYLHHSSLRQKSNLVYFLLSLSPSLMNPFVLQVKNYTAEMLLKFYFSSSIFLSFHLFISF